jgi:hypothetical protein
VSLWDGIRIANFAACSYAVEEREASMPDDVSIDVGSMYPYLEDRVLSFFGKDAATTEWKQRIQRLVRTSMEESSYVQCVGMARPIPIREIYQPTGLIRPADGLQHQSKVFSLTDLHSYASDETSVQLGSGRAARATISRLTIPWSQLSDGCQSRAEEEVPFSTFLEEGLDAVILAGPGWGKTTLLHWIHQQLIESDPFVPLLFTLRRPDVCQELEEFVRQLEKGRTVRKRSVVLLVDGYDEIDVEHRQRVSSVLMRFRALETGRFFLTCRSFYDIYDLKAIRCRLGAFSTDHAHQFIKSFSKAYGVQIDDQELLAELVEHGLKEFSSHPLMLALVCILKTGPNQSIPRRAIGLIRRAIDTLTFRWDEAKYIKRMSQVPLDGEERVRCLMRVAFDMKSLQCPWAAVEKSIAKHLDLLQLTGIDKRYLMREIAQWYGLVVPVDDENWQFVHRTIQDFLAARFWVESGVFRGVEKGRWDNRSAYAACLVPDATNHIVDMVRAPGGYSAFRECLYNGASFNMLTVAESVIDRVSRGTCELTVDPKSVIAGIPEDFFALASDEFLRVLVEAGSSRKGRREASAEANRKAGTAVACYALSELVIRSTRLPQSHLRGNLAVLYSNGPNRKVLVRRQRGVEFLLSQAIEPDVPLR